MFCAPSRASPREGVQAAQGRVLAPKGWRARVMEAPVLDEQEQNRPVNARGDRGVAQTRVPRAPEAERTTGIMRVARGRGVMNNSVCNMQSAPYNLLLW